MLTPRERKWFCDEEDKRHYEIVMRFLGYEKRLDGRWVRPQPKWFLDAPVFIIENK